MFSAHIIIVGQDDDVEAAEIFIVVAAPFSGPERIGGRKKPPLRLQSVCVLLPFNDKDARRMSVAWRLPRRARAGNRAPCARLWSTKPSRPCRPAAAGERFSGGAAPPETATHP